METSRLAFLGAGGLKTLRESVCTVVGAGGSGSHLVQQLAHLGIGDVVVIDPDRIERSNVNRVVGSTYRDVGRYKAELLAERFQGLGGNVVPLCEPVESPDAIAALQESAICFGAVDSFGARHHIEYFARMALVPVIDVGMQVQAEDGVATSAGGQIVVSIPGEACFWCMLFLTDERLALEDARYLTGAGDFAQQVICIDGLLASQAIVTALGILTKFHGPAGIPKFLSYNALTHNLQEHPLGLAIGTRCNHYDLKNAGWLVR